jgi:PGF-CTERM protein
MEQQPTRTDRRTVMHGLVTAAASVALLGTATTSAAAQETIELDGYTEGWEGLAPDSIADETNPTLELESGVEYTIVWHNQDGRAHNVVIEDEDGENLVRTDIITDGTQEVTFTATEEMVSYYCEVHPSTMRGDVEVSASQSTETPTSTPESTETPTPEPTETPTPEETPSGEVHEVSMVTEGEDYYFDPIGLHVEPGDTVRWVNDSGSHSATAYEDRIPDGATAFDSGILNEEGAEFEQTLSTEGTTDYFCTPHKSLDMVGRVVVGEPGGPAEGSMPPDGDVPESGRITDEESVAYSDFQSSATDTPTPTESGGDDGGDGGDESTEASGPGFSVGTALAALGGGALLRRFRDE